MRRIYYHTYLVFMVFRSIELVIYAAKYDMSRASCSIRSHGVSMTVFKQDDKTILSGPFARLTTFSFEPVIHRVVDIFLRAAHLSPFACLFCSLYSCVALLIYTFDSSIVLCVDCNRLHLSTRLHRFKNQNNASCSSPRDAVALCTTVYRCEFPSVEQMPCLYGEAIHIIHSTTSVAVL